jgi:hypothetical protein
MREKHIKGYEVKSSCVAYLPDTISSNEINFGICKNIKSTPDRAHVYQATVGIRGQKPIDTNIIKIGRIG